MIGYRRATGFIALILGCAAILSVHADASERGSLAIHERFQTLSEWEPLTFDNIERGTDYSIDRSNSETVLLIESNDGGSGLTHRQVFDVYENPILRWRWKVEDVISAGDLRTREGDAYPVRLYVNFEYDPEMVGFGTRVLYRAARLRFGEYPPHGSIMYIWSNREWPLRWYPNAFTDRARMLPIDQGRSRLMTWRTHRRNIVEDYRAAFGEDPPVRAQLAIMGDSWGTGETSRAWIDFISVGPE